ncbi:hypothetical protein V8E54_013051 [Elaphomyces granulatus]
MDYSYFPSVMHQPFQLYIPTPQQASPPQSEIHSALYDINHHFDPSYHSGSLVGPPHSPESSSKTSVTNNEIKSDPLHYAPTEVGDDNPSGRNPGWGSSEEKEQPLNPAQRRRKEQNRAAQRAFRERKEKHVRELEQKLNELQQKSSDLHETNERLKRELAKVSTENEILRATSSGIPNSSHGSGPEPATTGPMKFTPKDFSSLSGDGQPDPVHRIVYCEETGEKLLDARATWNLIQSHKLVKEHLADVGDVCERLKGHARCDGQGPVFEEGRVLAAITESVAGGNDELI